MSTWSYIDIAANMGCIVLLLLARYVWRASIAPRLDELERWRTASQEASRWLASYPEVARALDHVRGTALGEEGYNNIERVREEIGAMRIESPALRILRQALTDGVPLVEPVYIGKALLAQREARAVLSGGVGPVAAVHLVNIGLTGWIYKQDTAKAFARGYNRALKDYRSTLLDVLGGAK